MKRYHLYYSDDYKSIALGSFSTISSAYKATIQDGFYTLYDSVKKKLVWNNVFIDNREIRRDAETVRSFVVDLVINSK